MARVRSELRGSPRFGGRGNLYDAGYQYRVPHSDVITLGPFRRIWPLGERQVPKDTLQTLQDGIIRDGVIYPVWLRSDSAISNRTILAVDEYGLIPSSFRVEFYRDNAAGDVLSAAYDDGSSSGTDASAIVSDGTPIVTAAWQKYIYFGNPNIAEIRRYSPVDNAFTTVTGSPTPEFLFFVDNNLVAVYKSGSSWVVQWSVDSLPEDWTGAGSGLHVISGSIGEIKGIGNLNEEAIIIGSRGAVRMSPTGGASPAFKFDNLDIIRGTPYNCVIGVEDVVYYVDYKRRLVLFDGTRVEKAGEGMPFISSEPIMYASNRLGFLAVSVPDTDKTYFLDTIDNEWVAEIESSYGFFSDSPYTHSAGLLLGYNNNGDDVDLTTFDLEPDTYTQPQLATGRYDLLTEVWVDYVEIIRTGITAPVPVVKVLRQLNTGVIQVSSFIAADLVGISEQGTNVRYYVNAPAQFIEVQFGTPELEGPFFVEEYDDDGNYPVDVTNPSGYVRADLDSDGNYAPSASALTYVGSGVDDDGNYVLELADLIRDDVWLRDSGVESIKIMLTKMSNEPSAIG